MSMPGNSNIRVTAAVLFAVAAIAVLWALWAGGPPPANSRVFMDAETGECFEIPLSEDMGPFPLVNPRTKKSTLWPTEVCWSKTCGKKGGTRVILNTDLGKSGPTYCPKCGARIERFNARLSDHRN